MKLAVLVSGNGTNLQSIIDAIKDGYISQVRISYVISSNPDAYALKRAEESGIPTKIIAKKNMVGELKPIFDEVDMVVLAGFLWIIPDVLLHSKPVINVHPSLLPLFGGKGMYGTRVGEAVLASGMKVSGPTVHLVTNDIDGGPIIMQRCLEVRDDDTPESLLERTHPLEHQILVESIKRMSEKKYKIVGKRVTFP
ncbi:MAG: phosphoribosylglycinamide formyltransferase [Thermoplasmatales archaeon]|jgi:phosphoribosylglycinamide formyltransferase-1|nr:phosphoribosylglycinamide formyltransferase [Candidatus Thermoplasmatota archaeon]MDA8055117.1 phosphoribosylglycinamide formyltransferase [Thermoplasmatales archaeon]